MMVDMNNKLEKVMVNTSDQEKIRLFYELAKYIVASDDVPDYEGHDQEMETLFNDIANIINDIENL